MESIQRYDRYEPAAAASLTSVIARVHQDMLDLKQQLDEAHMEIGRLRQQLTGRRGERLPNLDVELRPLRRQVAFHCHPDRGGDDALLKRLNALFDTLEALETDGSFST